MRLTTLLINLLCWATAAPALAQSQPTSSPVGVPSSQPFVDAPASRPVGGVEAKGSKESDWTDRISIAVLVDAYYAVNYNWPEPVDGAEGESALRAFDQAQGFALSWAGLDLGYEAAPIGGSLKLRFGPAAARWAGEGEVDLGLESVREAYVTWKPLSRLSLDFGKFDTIYGLEAGDAHARWTYSLGTLAFFVQPNYHTGLRVGYALSEALKITAMAVNGFLSGSRDNNTMKSFGLQLAYTTTPFSASLGYFTGPERDGDNEHFMHFVDATLSIAPTSGTQFALNGDFGYEDADGGVSWWGAALLAQQRLSQLFRAGLRVELVGDPDGVLAGVPEMRWVTATLSLDALIGKVLMLRLENRLDYATEPFFRRDDNKTAKTQFTTTLAFVLYSGL